MVSQITVPLGDIYHHNPSISSHPLYIRNLQLLTLFHPLINENSYKYHKPQMNNLAQPLPGLPVKWKGLESSALGVHLILKVQLAAASVDVERVKLDPHAPVAHDDLVAEVEEEHDWRGKVVLEEVFGIGRCSDGLESLLA